VTSSPPSPGALAQQALQAAEVAYEAVRSFCGDNDADEVHEAWVVLHHESTSSVEDAADTATWVRQAAMMLLIGAGSELRAASVGEEEEEEVEQAVDEVAGAWTALAAGRLDEAAAVADRALQAQPADGPADGPVTHYANLILGHVCLRRDDEAGAERHLLAAGDTTGSPVLGSFGPNMALARELLERSRPDAVLAYFEKCARFWGALPKWTAAVRAGKMPDFGANLIYGIPKAAQNLVEESALVGDTDD
jgi:tetratricopeptide (TPR) repeat protein